LFLASDRHTCGRLWTVAAAVTRRQERAGFHLAHPPLASVAIPWEKIGYEAARIMEDIIAGARPPVAPVLLPPLEIVERLSSDVLAIPDRRVAAAGQSVLYRCA